MKNKWNKSTDLNLQIPESALNHITERRKKQKEKERLKKRVKEVIRNILDQVRFTSSSELGDLLMYSLHLSLVTGHGYMAPLRVRLPEFYERVRSKYVRQTLNGSIGVWRFSDVCDLSLT